MSGLNQQVSRADLEKALITIMRTIDSGRWDKHQVRVFADRIVNHQSDVPNAETYADSQRDKTISQHGKYNGWSNYATWRIYLEMFDGNTAEWYEEQWEDPSSFDGQSCKDFAEQLLEDELYNTGCERKAPMTLSYAYCFLADANWNEIAEHIRETIT